jgi:hypothetical protein
MTNDSTNQDGTDDMIAFDPVPSRSTRRDGWTEKRQRGFIAGLELCGSVNTAARAVGMTARGAYRLLERPGAESFARAWDEAAERGRQRMCDSAIERAMHGSLEPVFSRGRQVGTRRRYHDRLAIAVISNHGREAGTSRTEAAGIRRRRRELDEADKRAVAEYAITSARLAEADAKAAERYQAELAKMVQKGKRLLAEDRMKAVSIRVL